MSTSPGDDDLPEVPTTLFEGHRLRSAFQPIFSFSHQRLIGHEALIRATDEQGRALSPPALFARCADRATLHRLDRACTRLHVASYARQCETAQWLFLNIDVGAFVVDDRRRSTLVRTLLQATAESGLTPSQVVVELLEAALPDAAQVEHLTDELKSVGFNLALDDFGAGHSNFDRVFRLKPHIVKLDRSVIARAALDPRVRRVTGQMIALLHECGTQVLIEGVETADEAIIAFDSDADLVQGYRFGRPHATMHRSGQANSPLAALWIGSDERCDREARATAARLAPYGEALVDATRRLAAGDSVHDACQAFVRLPNADRCYLLDERGIKSAPRVYHVNSAADAELADRFAPLLDVRGSRWSRRPYFRTALAAPGTLQITRPYPAMHGPLMTVTLSLCFAMRGQRFVLCGDKTWRSEADPGAARSVARVPVHAVRARTVAA